MKENNNGTFINHYLSNKIYSLSMTHKQIQKVNITLLLIMFMADVEYAWVHIIVLRIAEAQNHKELTN